MDKRLKEIERVVHGAAKSAGKAADMALFRCQLAASLNKSEIPFRRQVWRPEFLAGMELNCGDLFDFEIDGTVAVVLAKTARELLEREKRLVGALERAGLEAGLVVWIEATRKDDRCRRVMPASCGAGA